MVVPTRCVDNTLTSIVPDSDLGLEDVPVMLVGLGEEEEDQEGDSWEESCFLVFSKFLGFLIKGYEGEIWSLMKSICERRDKIKGKGEQAPTKFERELKNLEWNMQEKSFRGGTSQRGKGIYNG